MATILLRARHGRPADRLRRRPAGQGRDGRRALRTARRRARRRRAGAARPRTCATAPSTSSAPAATARTRSTCRRWPRSSSPAPACRCASTAPAVPRRSAARPTCCEALGVAIELTPDGVRRCVEEAGIGFCFAPRFHPAFRFAAPARREIGIPTVFNLLGPMANPGRVRRQVIGVADPRFAERMLASLRAHGSTDTWVVHGGGLDELTTTGPSTVLALHHGDGADTFSVDPVELGLAPATHEQLVGGDPAAQRRRRPARARRRARRPPRHRRAQRRGRPGRRRRRRRSARGRGDRRAVDRRRQGGGGAGARWSGCPGRPRRRDRPSGCPRRRPTSARASTCSAWP